MHSDIDTLLSYEDDEHRYILGIKIFLHLEIFSRVSKLECVADTRICKTMFRTFSLTEKDMYKDEIAN